MMDEKLRYDTLWEAFQLIIRVIMEWAFGWETHRIPAEVDELH